MDAKVFGDGALAFVTATVRLPKKGGTTAVQLQLAAVVVDTPDVGWQWVSLAYQPPFEPAR